LTEDTRANPKTAESFRCAGDAVGSHGGNDERYGDSGSAANENRIAAQQDAEGAVIMDV